jgi:hypothetical protein
MATAVTELVSLLDVDRELAALVPDAHRGLARQAAAAGLLRLAAGVWNATEHADAARGGYGLLVVDGMLIRRIGVDGRVGAELLAAGDLLRPWQHDGENASGTLSFEATWRVVMPTRLAVLDVAWSERVARWPRLGAELAGRAMARSLRLAVAMAIAQQPRLEVRLWLLFWDLADRYGRVRPDGVHLELPLTHEHLSHLAGARRPSISAALGRLAADGRVLRERRTWILVGEPPALEAPHADAVGAAPPA